MSKLLPLTSSPQIILHLLTLNRWSLLCHRGKREMDKIPFLPLNFLFFLLSLFLPLKLKHLSVLLNLLLWPALELCHINLGIVIFHINLTHSRYHYASSLCCISLSGIHSTARLLHTKMVQLFNTWYTSLSGEPKVDKSRSDDVAILLPTPAHPWWAWSSQITKIKERTMCCEWDWDSNKSSALPLILKCPA